MTALFMLFLLVSRPACADVQTIDAVHLKDGTTLRGLIIEQQAGVSVKLASADGIVWTLEDREIDLIEKEPASEPLAVQYVDVVMLKDGVIFRGSVVEQRPGDSIILRTSSGAHLAIPILDVWMFVKRKVVVAAPAAAPPVDTETEPLRIRLQLEIARKSAADQGEPGAVDAAAGRTGGSASSLEQEIESLERQRDKADSQAMDEERTSERGAIETLDEDVSQLLDRLLADLQECSQQQAAGQADVGVLPVSYQSVASEKPAQASELASRYKGLLGEMVGTTLKKIPTEEVVAAREQQFVDRQAMEELLAAARQTGRFDTERIRVIADRLPADERQHLYETYLRTDGLKGALLNAIPFIFAGSWSQGDELAGRLGSLMLLASAAVDLSLMIVYYDFTAVQLPWGWVEMWHDPASPIFWIGPGCYLATYVVGIALPPLRANAWNAKLARVLRIDATAKPKQVETRAGSSPIALAPGSHGEPRIEVQLLSLRY